MLLNRTCFAALAVVCVAATGSWIGVSPAAHADDDKRSSTAKLDKVKTLSIADIRNEAAEVTGTASCSNPYLDIDDPKNTGEVLVDIEQQTSLVRGKTTIVCDGKDHAWKAEVGKTPDGDEVDFKKGDAELSAFVAVGQWTGGVDDTATVTLVK
ncbi:hypothetical protein GCM10009764_48080 [Nocardia ninae]|uniref:Lipoprotein n=2 Tax=Nocardia ninae TaxID=356145 RepID=A0A511MCH2_9NOCA|nr:hypothetical protein NN4_28710 [Nocardia ninae NBRC 108245]